MSAASLPTGTGSAWNFVAPDTGAPGATKIAGAPSQSPLPRGRQSVAVRVAGQSSGAKAWDATISAALTIRDASRIFFSRSSVAHVVTTRAVATTRTGALRQQHCVQQPAGRSANRAAATDTTNDQRATVGRVY